MNLLQTLKVIIMKTKTFPRNFFICLFLVVSVLAYSQDDHYLPCALKFKLQQALDNEANNLDVKGLSAAISLPDNKIITLVSGYSYSNVKVNSRMLFGVGSITKNFMTSLTLQLCEEGKLSLNDQIKKYFPDHNNIDGSITIKELLSHTSGIYDYTVNDTFFVNVFNYPSKIWTAEEIFTYVLSPVFEHGTNWQYSNTNYIILGCIIKNVTGNNISAELNNRILNPLKLHSTFFYPEEPYHGRLSHVWLDEETDFTPYVGTSLFSCAWTAGCLISTPTDLVKWSKALYGGKVICPLSIQKMIEPSEQNPNYALGTMLLNVNGQITYGHYGDILYNTYLNYFPDDSISIAVIGNKANTLMEGTMLALYSAYKSYKSCPDNSKIGITCYPNPFINSITFNYELFSQAKVFLKISNVFGKEIIVLVNKKEQKGEHTITWNGLDKYGRPVSAGPYIYTFIVDNKIYGGIIVKQ